MMIQSFNIPQLSESDDGESFEQWDIKRKKNIYEIEKEQMRLGLVSKMCYSLVKLHNNCTKGTNNNVTPKIN